MIKKNRTLFLFIAVLLFLYSVFFPFIRTMPGSGGVPGLSGLETVIFAIPYFTFLFFTFLNMVLVLLDKRSFPWFMVLTSLVFVVLFFYLTDDWNYNLTESLQMYLFGPIAFLMVNVLMLIVKIRYNKLTTTIGE